MNRSRQSGFGRPIVMPLPSHVFGVEVQGCRAQWHDGGVHRDGGEAPTKASGSDSGTRRAEAFASFAETVEPALLAARPDPSGKVAAFPSRRAAALADALEVRDAERGSELDERVDFFRMWERPEASGGGRRTIRIARDKSRTGMPEPEGFAVLDADGSRIGAGDARLVEASFIESASGEQRRRLDAMGLDILAFRSVRTELLLRRDVWIVGQPVRADFVYEAPAVTSRAPLVPLVDLAQTISARSGARTFERHVQDLLADLLGGPDEAVLGELSLNVVGSFELALAPGLDLAGEGIHFPGLVRTGWSSWCSSYAAAAASWRYSHRPPDGGRIVLDLRLLETATSRLILRIRRYEIAWAEVAW